MGSLHSRAGVSFVTWNCSKYFPPKIPTTPKCDFSFGNSATDGIMIILGVARL